MSWMLVFQLEVLATWVAILIVAAVNSIHNNRSIGK